MIRVKDTHFFITGKLENMDARQASSRIFELGGHVSSTVLPQVQVVLVGRGASEKRIKKAKGHGAIVLEGADIDALLRDGELDPTSGDVASLDELIGEARSVLASGESARAWASLIELVDRCAAGQLVDFVTYLEPQIARWRRDATEVGWLGHALGELRVMPADWLTAFLNGDSSPKYRLVHGVSFVDSELGAKVAGKLFSRCDQLPNLSTIQLDRKSLRKTLISKLLTSELAPRIEHLGIPSLYKQPLELITPIAEATTLSSIETIVLSNAPDDFFDGGALRGLKRVGFDRVAGVTELVPRLHQLPDLRALYTRLGGFWESDEQIDAAMGVVIDLLDASKITDIGISTTKSLALPGFFDAMSNSSAPIEKIDLTGIEELDCSQEAGATFWSGVLAGTRFATEGVELVLNDSFDEHVAGVLAGVGFSVSDAAVDHSKNAPALPTAPPTVLPEGELERRAARGFCVEDAMLVSDESEETWQLICGVMDGLAHQLDPASFSSAVARVGEFISHFSDSTRKLPRRWYSLLYKNERDPRLELVRTLLLDYYDYARNAKSSARHIEGLALAKQIGCITCLELHSFDAPKSVITALGKLIDHSGAGQLRLRNPRPQFIKKLEKERSGASIQPSIEELEHSRSEPILRSNLSGGGARVEWIEISTASELAALVSSEDVNEIVMLNISITRDVGREGDRVALEDIPSPEWTSLRALDVTTYDDDIAEMMATWLANARPVNARIYQPDAFKGSGVFERAYASTLGFDLSEGAAANWELLARDGARPGYLRLHRGRGAASSSDTVGALLALPATVRERLRGLVLPIVASDLATIPELLEALPELSVLFVLCEQLEDHFTELVGTFAQAEVGGDLGYFAPIDMSLFTPDKPPALNAAMTRRLGAPGSLDAARWVDLPGRSTVILER